MTIGFWCILAAAFLPYLGAITAKIGGRMPPKANHNPRQWLETLHGWPQRAHWYQNNAFEAFPPFAAAVIVAHYLHANQGMIDELALAFIGFRVAHYIFYVADLAIFRSLAFFGGVACVVWLFTLGA